MEDKTLKPVAITFPNEDTYVSPFTLCPKEVLQKSWIDKIGGTIMLCDAQRKVKSVHITDMNIYVELE